MLMRKREISLCGIIALSLHIVWTVLVIYLLWVRNSTPQLMEVVLSKLFGNCDICEKSGDAIAYANQIGRLDVISLILCLVTVIIAIFAFSGFWMVRSSSRDAARDEVQEMLKPIATEQLRQLMDSPEFRNEIVSMVRQSVTTDALATAVSLYFDDERPVPPTEANDIADEA